MLAYLRTRRSVRAFTAAPRRARRARARARGRGHRAVEHQPPAVALHGRDRARARARRSPPPCAPRADEMKAIIARGHHAEDFGNYGDFFHEPLESAAAIIVPQYREHPDLIADLHRLGRRRSEPIHDQRAPCRPSSARPAPPSWRCCSRPTPRASAPAGWPARWSRATRSDGCSASPPPWRMVGAVAIGHPAARRPPQPAGPQVDRRVTEFIE